MAGHGNAEFLARFCADQTGLSVWQGEGGGNSQHALACPVAFPVPSDMTETVDRIRVEVRRDPWLTHVDVREGIVWLGMLVEPDGTPRARANAITARHSS